MIGRLSGEASGGMLTYTTCSLFFLLLLCPLYHILKEARISTFFLQSSAYLHQCTRRRDCDPSDVAHLREAEIRTGLISDWVRRKFLVRSAKRSAVLRNRAEGLRLFGADFDQRSCPFERPVRGPDRR